MSKSTPSQVTTLDDAPTAVAQVAEKPSAVAVALAAGNAASLSGKRKVITIFQDKGEGGSDDVFIGLNGYSYVIKRGKPVDVPVEVVEILRNATQTVYEGQTQGGAQGREVPRYAFSAE